MPKGVPVATVAIDGADNAAILAAQILGVYDETLAEALAASKAAMEQEIMAKDYAIADKVAAMLNEQK